MALAPRRPHIGLALGSGSARGWAHIGVLHALQEAGIVPDVVCGTSIGALVGAAYATGQLPAFTDWAVGLDRRKVFQFMDFQWGGGVLKGDKLLAFLRHHSQDCEMESTAVPFAAVATDLYSGGEVWLRQGSMAEAVRASIALPGLFAPVERAGRWLVDGGLVNPVPVSLARAMGADIVIAVDLNADILRRHLRPLHSDMPSAPTTRWPWQGSWLWGGEDAESAQSMPEPALTDVVLASVNIMQMRITRSRLAGDPPELVVAPRLAHLELLDFHRAPEAIEAGRQAMQQALPELAHFGWSPTS